MKNGIFFVIDALRFDTLDDENKRRYLFPNLNKIIEKSSFYKCVANSRSTQFVLPSLFTLSYPLDYGGYDVGIRRRPLTVAEFLKKNGFQTCFISNCNQVGVTNGYERGFDEAKASVDFNTLLEQRISRTIKPKYLREKEQSREKAQKNLREEFGLFLDTLIKNIESYDKSIWTKKLLNSNLKLAKLFKLEKKILDDHIELIEEKIKLISPGNYRKFLGKKNISRLNIFIDKFFSGISWRVRAFISHNPKFFPFQWFGHIAVKFTNIQKKFYENIERLHETKKPFFMYVHCMDVHDNRDISDFNYILSKYKFFFKWLYARITGLTIRTFNYDASLMMVDNDLKKMFEMINSTKFNDTIFLITADHGSGSTASPNRGLFLKERFLEMYREDLEVPVIIAENKKNFFFDKDLIDSMDASRIFLNKLGIEDFPDCFKGQLMEKNRKDYVVSEHGGRGSPDLMLNDLYFVITKREEKLFVILKEKTLKAVAFFNLLDDPKEQNNLVDKIEYKRKINSLLENLHTERGEIINQRLKSQ
jgi:arylsulfatase A-like enzyme